MESQLKKAYRLPAFTLVELVIVLGILVVLGFLVSMSLGSLFNVSERANRRQMVIRQGDNVIEVISRMSRMATRAIDCDSSSQYFTIINPDGGRSRFIFVVDQVGPTIGHIASLSAYYGDDFSTAIETRLHNTKTQVTSFNLDCSSFEANRWGNWINLKFDMEDTINSTDPEKATFETAINFRNK